MIWNDVGHVEKGYDKFIGGLSQGFVTSQFDPFLAGSIRTQPDSVLYEPLSIPRHHLFSGSLREFPDAVLSSSLVYPEPVLPESLKVLPDPLQSRHISIRDSISSIEMWDDALLSLKGLNTNQKSSNINCLSDITLDFNGALPDYNNDRLHIDHILPEFESLKLESTVQLNSFENSFNKLINRFKKKKKSLVLQRLEEIKDLEQFLNITLVDDGLELFEASHELTNIFKLNSEIKIKKKQIKTIDGEIKYLLKSLTRIQNKRQVFRKISSTPFKNLDDYHSLQFI